MTHAPDSETTELRLSDDELLDLVRRVFSLRDEDRRLAVITDLPDAQLADHAGWRQRRDMALDWYRRLRARQDSLGLEVEFYLYRNARRNNADLPATAWRYRAGDLPTNADQLDPSSGESFSEIFDRLDLLLAPTELSTTAPLKLAAPRHRLRAATLPGFSPAMVPALRLDYVEIDRRVRLLKGLLDRAQRAELRFAAGGRTHQLTLDLRYRSAHASGGLLPEPGSAGNLPSGETYIVPYEGERPGDPSRSAGTLPVELDGKVVVYRIDHNQALSVEPGGAVARAEAARLAAEPAYGNLAELGLGVLADFGVRPVGEILLDEKLGLHIAFGRSDHFGGQVGAAQFSRPEAVVHIDRVYLPETQPRVRVVALELVFASGPTLLLMADGRYQIDFLAVDSGKFSHTHRE